ncbi:hypothetical protein KEM60_00314 [Austwickia sp. TVS 96-490-7B]|nr:hypothetical protein [Austwickia sp. TVS 96-490-7B]
MLFRIALPRNILAPSAAHSFWHIEIWGDLAEINADVRHGSCGQWRRADLVSDTTIAAGDAGQSISCAG